MGAGEIIQAVADAIESLGIFAFPIVDGLHEVHPYVYLVDVLQRIEAHPQTRVDELTPRLWKEHFADHPMRSAIDPG
jgi:hypothetical protein